MPDPEMIRKVPIFTDLTDKEIEQIQALCKVQVFQPGEIIIEEDTPGQALFVIRSGRARVAKLEGGCERNLAEVGAGEHVGEMSLVDGMNTSARVVADETTECIVLYKEDFDLLLAGDDQLHISILRVITRTLAERLRRTSEDLMVWKLEFNEED